MLDPTRAQGIDVNHYRPCSDFGAVFGAGMTFVGIKATEGISVVDSFLGAHRAGARAQPFHLVTYYHYARPGDADAQAERLMDRVGVLRDNERLALDVEGDAAPNIHWIEAFIAKVASAYPDRRPIVYTSARIWDQIGKPAWPRATAGGVDLWAPRYNHAGNEPALPSTFSSPVWPAWTFWQDSEAFPCPGVSGPCDHSVFRGTADELRAYAALAPLVA
jgi:lysozyme